MHIKKAFYTKIDFWIVSSVLAISLFYAAYSEIFPMDWLISHQRFKNNHAFIYKKSFNRLLICSKPNYEFNYHQFFNDPELLFQKTDHVFKNRKKKNKVALVEINGRRYVAKKYQSPNFFLWLKQIPFRSSKAMRAWYYGQHLSELNIPTPKTLLMIEKRIGPFCTSGYLLIDYIDGIIAQDYFKEGSAFRQQWPFALREIKKILTSLNNFQIIHGDLCLANIIIQNGKPFILDLDRIHFYRFDHAFYKRRYQEQHLHKISRKLSELNPEAEELYHDIFELPKS